MRRTGRGSRLRINYRVIEESKNFIYVVVCKSASRSHIQAVRNYNDLHNLPKKGDQVELPEVINDNRFKYTFIRNPWHRLVSCYGTWIHRSAGPLLRNPRFYKNMPFPEFVKGVVDTPFEETDEHFVPQIKYLTHEGGLFVDYVGKLEDEGDWKFLQEMLGLGELPHKNKNTKVKGDYRDFYTSELIELVREYYREDVEYFNYKW